VEIDRLLRPNILTLKPYSSARDEFKGQADVWLDANENPYGAPPDVSLPNANGLRLHRYPDPYQRALKQRVSELKGLPVDHIFLGNGSDECIDLLFRAFCEPGKDHVLTMPPTYGMYTVSANINDVEIREVPLTPDYTLDDNGLQKAFAEMPKLWFVCNPNNPTGKAFDRAALLATVAECPGLVVVDEAYADFSSSESLVKLVPYYPNLVVLQTFSKAWGMAAVRLGMAFADPEIIDVLTRIKPPYNIGTLQQTYALEALQKTDAVADRVKKIIEERARLADALATLPTVEHVVPSDANFLLVKIQDAGRLYRELAQQGIVVRNWSEKPHTLGCLRITIGTPAENDRLLQALKVLGA